MPERKKLGLDEESTGLFVAFEGTEGAGKTTQVEMLKDYLLSRGKDVIVTREPGGTLVGGKIREILLDPGYESIIPTTEALLFAADRAQEIQEVIRPALTKGWIVIADRFVDSSLAYQGVGRGLGLEAVKNLNEWATAGLEPQLTFLLDLPYEESLRRKAESASDRMENEPPEFHENVRQAYLMLARLFTHRTVEIDARSSAESIHSIVVREVSAFL